LIEVGLERLQEGGAQTVARSLGPPLRVSALARLKGLRFLSFFSVLRLINATLLSTGPLCFDSEPRSTHCSAQRIRHTRTNLPSGFCQLENVEIMQRDFAELLGRDAEIQRKVIGRRMRPPIRDEQRVGSWPNRRCNGPLWLPRWGNKWVGFHCAAIFRQTLIQSIERRATLIQRNSDRCSGALDHKYVRRTKSFF
jgi:hypothetical protein